MSSAAGFDPRRFKALERAGFDRIAARYADGARLHATLADALPAAVGAELEAYRAADGGAGHAMPARALVAVARRPS
ncbi:hypothetical protein [Thauera sinica]|uniref:Methyltransferase type 11 n=1 Tax=Thauera sinica TaxID=2665146 RepID=A0ABW1AUH9_9RHOO|nr:hypothetical protein [Thauera sp. K11]